MNNTGYEPEVFSLLKDYNPFEIVGTLRLSEDAKKLLSTGEYVIVPSWVSDDNGNRIIEFGLIHEDTLVREDGSRVLRKEIEK